jgi:hypothetical protein
LACHQYSDFNGDGRSDILFQNDSGEVAIWEVNGANVIGGGSLGNPGPSWHVIGTGQYNADNYSDLRFQNSSGDIANWELNGTNVIDSPTGTNPPVWHLVGDSTPFFAANVDLPWQSDGQDIYFQNDSGQAFFWVTSGTTITNSGSLGNPGPTWHLKATGDINGDRNPDLLWQNDDAALPYGKLTDRA